jgi:hypothetical protein
MFIKGKTDYTCEERKMFKTGIKRMAWSEISVLILIALA